MRGGHREETGFGVLRGALLLALLLTAGSAAPAAAWMRPRFAPPARFFFRPRPFYRIALVPPPFFRPGPRPIMAPLPPPPFPCPPPLAAAAVPAAPPPRPQQVFLVFFDWDKYAVTPAGMQIIREAAAAWREGAPVRIHVNGYTDSSGSPGYNLRLSLRRANAVARALERFGVPGGDLVVRGVGERHLRVPTAPGMREPQNRRVEIIWTRRSGNIAMNPYRAPPPGYGGAAR